MSTDIRDYGSAHPDGAGGARVLYTREDMERFAEAKARPVRTAAQSLKDALSADMLDEIGLWAEWGALQDALDGPR